MPEPERRLELAVIIATRNRARALESVLENLAAQQTCWPWQAVVVDNGSSDDTPIVLQRFQSRFPLRVLSEPHAGKSRALNAALGITSAWLTAFTDDDVILTPHWVDQLVNAARAYPEADVFCGPIHPRFPVGTPAWLRNHPFSTAAFARFEPPLPEGILPAPELPFGPNFAVRSDRAAGMRFRLDLGPSELGSFMCEDTEFVHRFRLQNRKFIFVPAADVTHVIRSELVSVPCLLDRAFNFGRSFILAHRNTLLLSRNRAPAVPEAKQFELGAMLNLYLGQLCQCSLDGERRLFDSLKAIIKALPWNGDQRFVGSRASEWICSNPEFLL